MDTDDEVKGWVVWIPPYSNSTFTDYPYYQQDNLHWYALCDLKYAEEIKALADLNGSRTDEGRFSVTFWMPKAWLEKKDGSSKN